MPILYWSTLVHVDTSIQCRVTDVYASKLMQTDYSTNGNEKLLEPNVLKPASAETRKKSDQTANTSAQTGIV